VYLAQCVGALLRSRGWRLLSGARGAPFRSFLDFCRGPRPHGLGLRRAEIEAILDLLGSSTETMGPR
jgi:hypothetical protein